MLSTREHWLSLARCLAVLTPCRGCGAPKATPMCRRCGWGSKASTTHRGYGTTHQRRAAALRAERRPCCICGGPIDYNAPRSDPSSFQAHHLTDNKSGPLDAAHRLCNAKAGKPGGRP